MAKQITQKDRLLDILRKKQEKTNFLSEEAIIEAAQEVNVPVSHVYGVATFYSLYSTKPRGKNIIRVCENAPCHIDGAKAVLEAISDYLGIEVGQTTQDKLFTLETTSCLGVCGVAPAIMVNDNVHGNLTPDTACSVLAGYKE